MTYALEPVLSLKAKTNLVSLSSISLVLILLWSGVSAVTAQQTAARALSFPVAIQWNKQTGVRRYRLQIAADEKFQDVFFDGLVTGERYVASDLPAGSYFWRVVSADSNLRRFSPAVCFFVSGGIVTHVALPNRARLRR